MGKCSKMGCIRPSGESRTGNSTLDSKKNKKTNITFKTIRSDVVSLKNLLIKKTNIWVRQLFLESHFRPHLLGDTFFLDAYKLVFRGSSPSDS
jgi:hypothetical protein